MKNCILCKAKPDLKVLLTWITITLDEDGEELEMELDDKPEKQQFWCYSCREKFKLVD